MVYRFLEFNGVGPKIASMAANILAREFKIPFADYFSIDISAERISAGYSVASDFAARTLPQFK